MKKVLLIAHFCSDFGGKGNNRFNYLAQILAERYELEFITTDFSHVEKRQREKISFERNYRVTMLHEPGYKKNVSLKRIYAHHIFSLNLKKYLISMEVKPSVIYCAVPSLDVASVVADYAKKNKVKLIVDVQDLWPDAFQMVLNVPLIFEPMKRKAKYIYKSADELFSVSQTYSDKVERIINNKKKVYPVYIGTDLSVFDKCVEENRIERNDKDVQLAYCGTLGNSYDIKSVIDAVSILQKQGYGIQFKVMGDGPLRSMFEKYAKEKSVNAIFTGNLPYAEMCSGLVACDITVNPIVAGSAGSIINKHADYAASGLPVINTQENEEYRKLVEEYQMGFNCENGNSIDMANRIKELIDNPELAKQMGVNARRCAEEKFDRKYTYAEIIEKVECFSH